MHLFLYNLDFICADIESLVVTKIGTEDTEETARRELSSTTSYVCSNRPKVIIVKIEVKNPFISCYGNCLGLLHTWENWLEIQVFWQTSSLSKGNPRSYRIWFKYNKKSIKIVLSLVYCCQFKNYLIYWIQVQGREYLVNNFLAFRLWGSNKDKEIFFWFFLRCYQYRRNALISLVIK